VKYTNEFENLPVEEKNYYMSKNLQLKNYNSVIAESLFSRFYYEHYRTCSGIDCIYCEIRKMGIDPYYIQQNLFAYMNVYHSDKFNSLTCKYDDFISITKKWIKEGKPSVNWNIYAEFWQLSNVDYFAVDCVVDSFVIARFLELGIS